MDLGNQPETQSPGVSACEGTPRGQAPLAAQGGGVNGACVQGTLWHRVWERRWPSGEWEDPWALLPGPPRCHRMASQEEGHSGRAVQEAAEEPLSPSGSRALTGLAQPLARRRPCLQSARRAAWVSPSKELRAHGTACHGTPSSESCGAHTSGDTAPRQPRSNGTGIPSMHSHADATFPGL